MKLSQLRALSEIARAGSIQRAAKNISLSQPALSKAVRALELELGTSLLERTSRGVLLTPCGQVAVKRAQTIEKELDRLIDEIGWLKDKHSGSLSIGLTPIASGPGLARAVARMRHDYPAVEIRLIEGRSSQILEGLRNGMFDLGLISSVGDAGPAGGQVLTQFATRLLIGRPEPAQPVTIEQLMSETWINVDISEEQNYLQVLFSRMGAIPENVLQCSSVSLAVDLAPRLGAIIYLTEPAIPFFSKLIEEGQLTPLQTSFALPTIDVGLVVADKGLLSPAAERFIRYLKTENS